MRLKDKVAVVTGAGSGIGKEIALTFARAGAKVALADLDTAGADLAASEINHEGAQAIALGVDVTNEAQVNGAVDRVVEAYGRLDVLVSNAGITVLTTRRVLRGVPWAIKP